VVVLGRHDRHREGRPWLEEALAAPGPEIDPPVRAYALSVLCYIAGQQLDFERAVPAGEQAIALSRTLGNELALASAKQALALTLEAADEHERSSLLLAEARGVLDAAEVHQRVVVNDIITSVQALTMGDLDRLDSASQEVLRRCEVIDYEPYRCWGHLLRARLHQERQNIAGAVAECQLAVSSARLLDLAHFRSFALTQLGQLTAITGNLLGAKTLLEEAIAEAEKAGAGCFAAFAKVALVEVLRQQETRQTPTPYFKRSSIGAPALLKAEVGSRFTGALQTIRSSLRRLRNRQLTCRAERDAKRRA
jgi:tetratricopeptide (TPR) repeat protein